MQKRLFSLLLTVMCMSVSTMATAQTVVQSSANPDDDPYWMRTFLQVVNGETQDMEMSDYTLEYYFFDESVAIDALSASVWYYSLGDAEDVAVSFETVTPPDSSLSKSANYVVRIQFMSGTLTAGNSMEVKIGTHAEVNYSWHMFDFLDDWSYAPGISYKNNVNVVLRDEDGNIIYGEEPCNDTHPRPYGVEMYWMGEQPADVIADIQWNEGDAFKSSDDGKGYVFYQNSWMPIDDNVITADNVAVVDSGLGADDVQAALEALTARVSALESENAQLQAQVDQNSADILSLFASQVDYVTQSALDATLDTYITFNELFNSLLNYTTTSETAAIDSRLADAETKTSFIHTDGAEFTISADIIQLDANLAVNMASGAEMALRAGAGINIDANTFNVDTSTANIDSHLGAQIAGVTFAGGELPDYALRSETTALTQRMTEVENKTAYISADANEFSVSAPFINLESQIETSIQAGASLNMQSSAAMNLGTNSFNLSGAITQINGAAIVRVNGVEHFPGGVLYAPGGILP